MSNAELELYEALKPKLGGKEAKMLLEVMESKVEKDLSVLATKADLAELKADIIKWMFIFWVGAVFTFLGSLLAIFKFAQIF